MNINNIKKNIITAIVFIIISVLMIWVIIPREVDITNSWGTSYSAVNSQTFPMFACAIFGLASVGMLIDSIIKLVQYKAKNGTTKNKEKVKWKDEFNAIIIFGMFVAYGLLFKFIGFLLASLIIAPLVLLVRKDKNWKHYVVVEVLAALIFLVFRYVLKIML